jgi:hypothetical protein
MSSHAALLREAAKFALPNIDNDLRLFWLASVGIRERDGVKIKSQNGASRISTPQYKYEHSRQKSHAEGRICRKLGANGTIYVARVAKENFELKMSRPCNLCRSALRSYRVKRCFYSINETHFGCFYPAEDRDQIFHF